MARPARNQRSLFAEPEPPASALEVLERRNRRIRDIVRQAIVCLDDPGVRDVLGDIGRSVVTYGVDEGADLRAVNIRFSEGRTDFDVVREGSEDRLQVSLSLPGLHNVKNALAAIAVADELGIGFPAVRSLLLR